MSDEETGLWEPWELTDEALAEMTSGHLRRVKTPGGRILLMTADEIRAAIDSALGHRDE